MRNPTEPTENKEINERGLQGATGQGTIRAPGPKTNEPRQKQKPSKTLEPNLEPKWLEPNPRLPSTPEVLQESR